MMHRCSLKVASKLQIELGRHSGLPNRRAKHSDTTITSSDHVLLSPAQKAASCSHGHAVGHWAPPFNVGQLAELRSDIAARAYLA